MKLLLQPTVLACTTLAMLSLSSMAADQDKKPAAEQKADANADNTEKNARDRESNTTTPLDQSNSEEHIKITQNIRKAVMADDGLSTNGKNVKIITTADGKVTLRGPVNSEEEKTKIAAYAKKYAGTATVVNQIEVKAAK